MANPADFGERFVRNATIYGAGNIIRQVVGFLMLPLYTRYLTPADYGVVALIAALMGVIETLFSAKLVQAIPRFYADARNLEEKNTVVSTAFIVTGGMSTLTVLLVALFSTASSRLLFGVSDYAIIVTLCGTQILTQALEYYGMLYLRLLERPWWFFWISLGKLAVQVALNVALVVYLDLGVLGVATSGLASSAIFAIGLSVWSLSVAGVSFDFRLAKRLWEYSWPLWLGGIASLYIASSNKYFIRIFDSIDGVGLFELASKFAAILSLLVWGPISQHWQTEQFAVVSGHSAEARLNLLFTALGALLFGVGIGIMLLAPSVISIMAAPPFHAAAPAVPFLIYSAILTALGSLASSKFLAEGETRFLTLSRYGTAVCATVFYLTLVPLTGFVGAAISVALAEAVQLAWILIAIKKRHGISISAKCVYYSTPIGALAWLACTVAQPSGIVAEAVERSAVAAVAVFLIGFVLWMDTSMRPILREIALGIAGRLNRRVPNSRS